MGLPRLTDHDAEKVRVGIKVMQFSCCDGAVRAECNPLRHGESQDQSLVGVHARARRAAFAIVPVHLHGLLNVRWAFAQALAYRVCMGGCLARKSVVPHSRCVRAIRAPARAHARFSRRRFFHPCC